MYYYLFLTCAVFMAQISSTPTIWPAE